MIKTIIGIGIACFLAAANSAQEKALHQAVFKDLKSEVYSPQMAERVFLELLKEKRLKVYRKLKKLRKYQPGVFKSKIAKLMSNDQKKLRSKWLRIKKDIAEYKKQPTAKLKKKIRARLAEVFDRRLKQEAVYLQLLKRDFAAAAKTYAVRKKNIDTAVELEVKHILGTEKSKIYQQKRR